MNMGELGFQALLRYIPCSFITGNNCRAKEAFKNNLNIFTSDFFQVRLSR